MKRRGMVKVVYRFSGCRGQRHIFLLFERANKSVKPFVTLFLTRTFGPARAYVHAFGILHNACFAPNAAYQGR